MLSTLIVIKVMHNVNIDLVVQVKENEGLRFLCNKAESLMN